MIVVVFIPIEPGDVGAKVVIIELRDSCSFEQIRIAKEKTRKNT